MLLLKIFQLTKDIKAVISHVEDQEEELHSEINKFLKIDREELYSEKRLHQLSFNHHGKEQYLKILHSLVFLVNSRYSLVIATFSSSTRKGFHLKRHTFSRSYSANLASSLIKIIPIALEYSSHSPEDDKHKKINALLIEKKYV